MRKSCLAVIGVVLLAGLPAAAQESSEVLYGRVHVTSIV